MLTVAIPLVEQVMMLCWSLWQNRNNIFWNCISNSASSVIHMATSFLHQWNLAQADKKGSPDDQEQNTQQATTNLRPY